MQSKSPALSISILALLGLCRSEQSLAGELMLYEIATDDTGLASEVA